MNLTPESETSRLPTTCGVAQGGKDRQRNTGEDRYDLDQATRRDKRRDIERKRAESNEMVGQSAWKRGIRVRSGRPGKPSHGPDPMFDTWTRGRKSCQNGRNGKRVMAQRLGGEALGKKLVFEHQGDLLRRTSIEEKTRNEVGKNTR